VVQDLEAKGQIQEWRARWSKPDLLLN
jgi:hypothetical protein